MTTDDVSPGEFWFYEKHVPTAGIMLKVGELLACRRSRYQTIQLFDTADYGRVMTLDNLIMLTERDEFSYHEMLTHVPLLLHPQPRQVLVVGGGDGGVLREVIKHGTVERAVQVEIDREVVDVCREFFPWAAETYDNPRVELVIDDALKYINTVRNEFDLVIVDSTDPVGPAIDLFGSPFYSDVYDALTADGLMTCQIDSPFYGSRRIGMIMDTLRDIFHDAGLYLTQVPSYPSGVWGLGIASKSRKNFHEPDKVRYDTLSGTLRYYNPDVHRGSFLLPEYLRRVVYRTGK
ncbi:MAG TPA: polyamine aminopropyltransferase [Bacteroidetes bacterium]|nr:polyamine aminopropyltransferase [Bacteroidota bacterium]